MITHGYSIWLIPQGEIYKNLSKLISQLAQKYSFPNFEPHVTLIGGILLPRKTVIEKIKKIASSVKPFNVKSQSIDLNDNYLRTLFFNVEKSSDLLAANFVAGEIFNIKQEDFMPHLSLMYGNFIPQIKRKIINEIGNDFHFEFKVDRLHLFKTDGEVVIDWKKIAEFELTGH